MNRWKYDSPLLLENENTLALERNVRLYDGNQKTNFEGGELTITTHRLLWGRPGDMALGRNCLTLDLNLVVYIEEESPSSFSFSRSRKILLHLSEPNYEHNNQRPYSTSIYNFIKLSFKEGFSSDVVNVLLDVLQKQSSNTVSNIGNQSQSKTNLPQIKLRTGIMGIERSLQERQKATDESISIAFQDLDKLMTMAKDMVRLSRTISSKIKEKQGDITEDETVRFKSYLLSLGIDDPVTRDNFKSNNQYFISLAKQICDILISHVEEMGGMIALADAFCRVNRARGLELLSPQDLLNSCQLMESLDLPLKLYQFSSGVMVLQLSTLNNEIIAQDTFDLLEEKGSLNAEQLAQSLGISITLAKERLLTSEKYGKTCRDDSIEGLRFYPNLILSKI